MYAIRSYYERTKDTKMSVLKIFVNYVADHFDHNDLRNITTDNIREFLKHIETANGERTGEPYSKRFIV